MKIDIRFDTRGVERELKRLAGPAGVTLATARALNRAAEAVRSKAITEIREARQVPRSYIAERLRIVRARRDSLRAEVHATGGAIAIRNFAMRSGKRGVTVKVSAQGARVLLRRYGNAAFVNPRLGRGLTPFVRKGKKRLPIERWPGVPGIASTFAQKRIDELMRREASTVFLRRFQHELQRIIGPQS